MGSEPGAGGPPGTDDQRDRVVPAVRAYLVMALVALGGAVVLTLPASVHLTTALVGHGSDPLQSVWNVAWVQGWLAGAHPLYRTHQLLAPRGANLAWMTLALPAAVLGALLRPVLGLVAAYNVALLVSLAADGVAGYCLARVVGLRRVAAGVAGLSFEGCPYLVGEARAHLHMVGAYAIPLVLAALWSLLARRRPSWWRYVLLGGLVALACYDAPDYGVLAVLGGLVVTFTHPATRQHGIASLLGRWRGWLVAGAVALLGVAPLVAALAFAPLGAAASASQPLTTPWVADLVALVVPEPWGLFAFLRPHWSLSDDLADGAAFPGFLAWMAMLALLAWRPHLPTGKARAIVRSALWGVGVSAVLSLGPFLHVGGVRLPVPLPEAILAVLPGTSALLPVRFSVLVAIFAALLVGVAVETALAPVEARRTVGRRRSAVVVAAAMALLLLASVAAPFPSERVVRAGRGLGALSRGSTVLFAPGVTPVFTPDMVTAPYPASGYAYLALDAELGFSTPQGYVSRVPPATASRVARSAVLGYLSALASPDQPSAGLAARAAPRLAGFLRRSHVTAVVLLPGELVEPEADVRWFARHAGVASLLVRVSPTVWVLRLGLDTRR